MENTLEKAVSEIIDGWANDLIKKLISGASAVPQRGLWDRFKGGLANLFYGRTGDSARKNNPYYWKNRFGDDLGADVKESFTVSDYDTVKSLVEDAESFANSLFLTEEEQPKLRIFGLIRGAAEDLKRQLMPVLSKYIEPSGSGDEEEEDEEVDHEKPSGSAEIKPDSPAPPAPPKKDPPAPPVPPKKDPPAPPVPPKKDPPAPPVPPKKDPPAPPASPASSASSKAPKTIRDIYEGKKTKEEVLEAISEKLISPLTKELSSKREKKRLGRLWRDDYMANAPSNINDLKEAIENGLVEEILRWGFSEIDKDKIDAIIQSI